MIFGSRCTRRYTPRGTRESEGERVRVRVQQANKPWSLIKNISRFFQVLYFIRRDLCFITRALHSMRCARCRQYLNPRNTSRTLSKNTYILYWKSPRSIKRALRSRNTRGPATIDDSTPVNDVPSCSLPVQNRSTPVDRVYLFPLGIH